MADGMKRKAWSIVLAGTGINLALGILYTWSIFKGAIAKEGSGFDWGTDKLNDPYALCCLVFAFAMILAGRVQDRFGPRVTAFIGGILVAIGLVISSQSASYVVWLVGFGLFAGVGIGFGYSSATPPGLKWFPSWKTGMVAGVVVSGFGLASVYIAPLAKFLLGEWGLQSTMLFFGLAFAVVVSALAMVLRNPPTGYDPKDVFGEQKGKGAQPAPAPAPSVDVKSSDVLKTGRFWLLWSMYAIGAGAGLMVIGGIAGMAKGSLGESAFIAVALLAVGNAAGRIVAGILSDKIGRRQTLLLMLLFQAVLMFVAIPVLGTENIPVLLVLLATLIGFNYGTNLALFPSLAKDNWGLKNFGMNYGLLFTAWGVGGFILSRLSQMLVATHVEAHGESPAKYTASFVTAGILLVLAAAMTFLLRDPTAAAEKVEEPERELVGAK